MSISTRPDQMLSRFGYQAAHFLAQDISCPARGQQAGDPDQDAIDLAEVTDRLGARPPVPVLRRPGLGLHRATRLTQPLRRQAAFARSRHFTDITCYDLAPVRHAARTAVLRMIGRARCRLVAGPERLFCRVLEPPLAPGIAGVRRVAVSLYGGVASYPPP